MSCACNECNKHSQKEKVEKEDRKQLIITIARLATSLALALLGLLLFTEEWGDAHLGAGNGLWLNLSVLLVAWLIAGYDIALEAVENVIKNKNPFDENVLMVIASIGAFCLRFFGQNEFFEAVMIVLLYQVGEMFEDFASERSHKAISDAVGLRAKTANLLKDGAIRVVDPEELEINDEVLIKVGEIVPADGVILKGDGSFDMSSLTGEFVPVTKKEGEFVNSGIILKSGSVTVKVTKSYEDSTVSHILRLVEESEGKKSKADKFIAKFAKIYTPVVVSLAVLLAVIPPLILGYNDSAVWSHWVYTAICLLVISCPCAVVVSVPLSYFAGIGLASKNGVLVKGASYFDKLNELDLLVTDKTGTLTYGRFALAEKEVEGIDEKTFDEFLYAAESRSNHPIAKTIIGNNQIDEIAKGVESYEEIAGHGVKIAYKGHVILAGNAALLEKYGVSAKKIEKAGTIVMLASDGVYHGYVLLSDEARPQSIKMIEELRKRNIDTLMLTGDKREGAAAMAKKLGLTRFESELLPDDKTALLKKEIDTNPKAVAFLGDGINDAPSIALADVGIAMGGSGSDLAVENADIVIMDDDPSKVVTALEVANKTRTRAKWDVIIALGVKFLIGLLTVVMPYIAAGNELPMFVAVLADTGLTAVLILYSVTLLHSKTGRNRR